MITKHLDLSLTLILIVAVANVIAGGICFYLAPHMAIIARVPGRVIVPLTLGVIFVGSFAFQGQFADLIILLIFSVIGVAGQRLGYNLRGIVYRLYSGRSL